MSTDMLWKRMTQIVDILDVVNGLLTEECRGQEFHKRVDANREKIHELKEDIILDELLIGMGDD